MATLSDRPPLVLIPGIQGRWEYMRRAVDALSKHFHVLTFSLCNARTMEAYVDQVVRTIDENTVRRAVVLGESFGGVVAQTIAVATHIRSRVLYASTSPT